jgi:hypothetical protein
MSKILTVANEIQEQEVRHEKSCYSLMPLAFALMEAVDLYSFICDTSNKLRIANLFDANEVTMPNIDTRLRTIRDLCSASNYGLQKRSEEFPDNTPVDSKSLEGIPLGEGFWLETLRPYLDTANHKDSLEVARLLDDVLESVIIISENLNSLLKGSVAGSWNETYRQTSHIRDHFDYAEDSLISCIREDAVTH